MKVQKLDTGLAAISRWRIADEVHLPATDRLAPIFVPATSALDAILFRPNLDERLVGLMQPQTLDPDLLDAAVLSRTRRETRRFFWKATRAASRSRKELRRAAQLLADEVELDTAVTAALSALLRG